MNYSDEHFCVPTHTRSAIIKCTCLTHIIQVLSHKNVLSMRVIVLYKWNNTASFIKNAMKQIDKQVETMSM